MSDIKLRECPFCGGEARTDSCGSHWVRCTVCGARGCVESTRKEAIEQWNIRKPMEHYKLGNSTNDCEHFDNAVTYGYNKAIDDFTEKATKIVYEANDRDRNPQPRDIVADIHYKLVELAEQLKEGGSNG